MYCVVNLGYTMLMRPNRSKQFDQCTDCPWFALTFTVYLHVYQRSPVCSNELLLNQIAF